MTIIDWEKYATIFLKIHAKLIVISRSYFNASFFFAQYVSLVVAIYLYVYMLVKAFKFWFNIAITYSMKHTKYEAFFKFCTLSILAFHQQKTNSIRAENLLNLFRLCLYKMRIFFFIWTLNNFFNKKKFISPPHVLFNNLSLFFILSEWIFIIQKDWV